MLLLYLRLLLVTLGLGTELVFLGAAFKDREWFDRLGFREETREVARMHTIIESVFVAVLGIFFVVGLMDYLGTPQPVPPMPPARVIASALSILAACALPSLSIYLRLRRKAMLNREEKRQLEQLEEDIAAAPRPQL